MDPEDVKHLVKIYEANPGQFDSQSYRLLEVQAENNGIPLRKNTDAEDFDLINTAKQAVYGVVKGGTGVFDPGVNDRPRNQYEEYAKSLGELGGFLGLMFTGIGETAGILTAGARMAESASMLAKGAEAVGGVTEAVETFAKGASAWKSVPVLAGEKLVSAVGAERAAAAAEKLGSYFGGSEMAVGIANQAIKGGLRMAGAGAVSAVTLFDGKTLGETAHDVVSGAMYGMMFGGAMDAIPANALARLPWVKDSTTTATIFKSMLGSITNAFPAAVGGADGTKIMYEAVVGAFFGAKSVDWQTSGFHEIYAEHDKGDWGMATLSNPDALKHFEGQSERHRQYQEFINELHHPDSRGNIFRALQENFRDNSDMKHIATPETVHEISNLGYMKFGMGDRFTDGHEIYTEVSRGILPSTGEVVHITGRTDEGVERDIPVSTQLRSQEEPLPETNNVLPSEPPLELLQKQSLKEDPISEFEIRSNSEIQSKTPKSVPEPQLPLIVVNPPLLAPVEAPGAQVAKEPIVQNAASLDASTVKIVKTPNAAAMKNAGIPVEDTGVVAGGRLALGGPVGAFRRVAIVINNILKDTPQANENYIRAHTNNLWAAAMHHATEFREGRGIGFNALLNDYVNHPRMVEARGGKVMTAEDVRPLIPMWNSLTQRITHEHMSWNAKLGKLVPYSQAKDSSMAVNGGGDPVDTSGSRNWIHLITNDDRATVTIAGYTDKDGDYQDLAKGSLSVKDFNTINNQLMEKGYYLFSGGADKSMFVGVKWIDQGVDIQHYLEAHLKEMGEEYRADYEAFFPESGMTRETYDRTTVNNLIYYEKMNNMTVGEAMASEGMIKKVVDFNKRMQPLLTNFYQLDPSILAHFTKGEKLNYHMVLVRDDSDKPGGNGRPVENTDGSTTSHSRNVKAHGRAMGVPDHESHLKSFILHMADKAGIGTLINKHGEQTATPDMDRMLDESDLGYISRVSGSKQYGNRTVYRMRTVDGKLEFSEGGYDQEFVPVKREEMDVTELKPKDFRISSSIHDDTAATLNHAITYPKQAIYHMSIYETGEKAIQAHMDWIIRNFKGDEKLNQKFNDYMDTDAKKRTPGDLTKMLSDFDSIGVEHVLKAIARDPNHIGKLLFQKILGVSTGTENGLYKTTGDGEDLLEIPDNLNGVKRLIAFSAEHNILYSRLGRKVTEQMMTRYVVNRLTKPKVQSAGHSTMHGNTLDMINHINGGENLPDRLTKENFFLDDGKKQMRIKGVVYHPTKKGELKEGWTTLELQQKSYLKAKTRYDRAMSANNNNESEIDAKILSDYTRMGEALDFSVTRVPIDSFSGSVRLRFGGFTGLDGGGILLHGGIKEQLAGADNDGDTAYYYHGLPREYLDALDRAKGNFSDYADVVKQRSELHGTDEKRIFFTDGEGVYAEKKESKAGTFNSIFRAMVGHAVSKGRGTMLPVAVKYVDLMKKLLDTAYSKDGRLDLWNEAYQIHLTARDYSGKGKGTGATLGAYGQRAINSAADAGKESGMVSQERMQSVLLASAFKKIEVSAWNEEKQTTERHTIFDADAKDFNRGNLSETLDGLVHLVDRENGTFSLSGTEVGRYEHFINTMFGYNTADHRPWSLNEVNDAAGAVPKMFKTPYTDIIPLLRDTKFSDGLLHRVLPNKTNFLSFLENVRSFSAKNKVLADSILDGGVVIEYKRLTKLLNLYSDNYDVGPRKDQITDNLATSRGMRNYGRDDLTFLAYLKERLKVFQGMPNQMTLSAMEKKYGAFWTYDEPAIKSELDANRLDRTQKTYTDAERQSVRALHRLEPIVENRVKFLRDEYYQVSDYLSSRIEDVGAMMFIRHKTDQAGITDQDSEAIRSVIPDSGLSAALIKNFASSEGKAAMKPSLLDLVKMIKYSQDMFHKKEWTKDIMGGALDKFGRELVYSAQEAMNLALTGDEHVRNITERINEARLERGEAPVDPAHMQELYEALMVSSVMKGGQTKGTGQQMWGLNAVSDKTISDYARTMGDVFIQSQKNPKWVNIDKMFTKIRDMEAKRDVSLEVPEPVPPPQVPLASVASETAPLEGALRPTETLGEAPALPFPERSDAMSETDKGLLSELEGLDKIPWADQTEEQSRRSKKLHEYLDVPNPEEDARAELRRIEDAGESEENQDRVLELERVISGERIAPLEGEHVPFVGEYASPHEEVEHVPYEFDEDSAASETPVEKAEAAKPEAKDEKEAVKIIKVLGHFKDRLDAGGLDPRTRTKLTKKEQMIFDPIWKFIEVNKGQFSNGFQDVVDLFNGMLTSGKNNPNQYTLSDMEGLANHFRRLSRFNTIFGTLADLTTPGTPHAVNWMTWMHLPITNAQKLFGLDEAFYIKHQKIFGTDGRLDPGAEVKRYQDDEGRLHDVYADGALPMNILLRNLNAHTSMDYVQGEIGKKADAFFAQIFQFLHGGVKVVSAPGHRQGEDVTNFIREYAIQGRQMDGAVTDGNSMEASEFRKRRDLMEERWAKLKDAKLKIREAGADVVMSGEQVHQRIRGALDELATAYRKFITMDNEDVRRFFVLNEDGGIDLRETSKRFDGLLNQRKVTRIASYDTMNFFNYLMAIDHYAGEALKTHVRKSQADVESLDLYKNKEKLRAILPVLSSATKAQLYLKAYDSALRRRPDPNFSERETPDPGQADIFKKAKYHAEVDKLRRAEMKLDSRIPGTEHMDAMTELRRYFRTRISDTDTRFRVFGESFARHVGYTPFMDSEGVSHVSYSQYEMDKFVHSSTAQIKDIKEYYTQKLMNEYRFRETQLISGWFPHRNWDPNVLEAHIKRNYEEAMATEPMSVPDQGRFLETQNTLRMLKGETKDPESTDNGEMYDAMLSKTGYAPLEHIIGSSPGALKTRAANFEGYSMNPYEMRMAVMSVQRSGLAKLTATLNNDAILKFEARAGRLVNGAPAVNPAVIQPWVEYIRHMERQAFNRPSIFTNKMLSDPLTRIKWTPAYWFSDHAMLMNGGSKLNRWYRQMTKADTVTDLDKVIFKRRNGRDMTVVEEAQLMKEKEDRFLDFSTDSNGEFTPKALKNMETASVMFKRFSQFEAKIELSSLLFHTKFAVANVYGGVMNDYIYSGFKPLRDGRSIEYWNKINSNWKTMADVDRFFEDSGVIESIILKDTGYQADPNLNRSRLDKVTEKSAYFMRITETYLRREAAKHGYIAARESLGEMGDQRFDSEYLLSMARHSVEATQFLYNNHNRPAFMASNLGKVFTRFKLWGMNSFRMQGDIINHAADQGFRKGSLEMARFQRMMTANLFMFGLASMFPHTIFQSQLPQPVDAISQLAGVFFGDDEENKKKRKNLMTKMEDPIRDMVELPTKIPGISFPFARAPLALYDAPSLFRAIWSHDVHDMATATTMNLMPFGRFTKDVLTAYQSPSMAAELLAGIPLHRVDNFYTSAKKQRMRLEMLEEEKAKMSDDGEIGEENIGKLR